MNVSLFEASASQALFHEAHGIYEVARAKLLEACSKQRARVADTLLCELILLQPNQSLLHCSLNLLLSPPSSLSLAFSWSECAQHETIVS